MMPVQLKALKLNKNINFIGFFKIFTDMNPVGTNAGCRKLNPCPALFPAPILRMPEHLKALKLNKNINFIDFL